jgi:aldose 1-epimerase
MMTMRWAHVILITMMTTLGAQGAVAATTVTKAVFGKLRDGTAVDVYTLKSADLAVRITNYGARVVSIETKDRDGKMGNVVLGYNSAEGYAAEGNHKTYFGAIVGRYGNRIRGGKFTIDGHTYQIPVNNGRPCVDG